MIKKTAILSTAALGNGAVEHAGKNGIAVDVVPFIDVNYLNNDGLVQEVKKLAKEQVVVVFTSKHAIHTVAKILDCKEVNWSIYCLGNKSLSVANQYFSKNIIYGVDGDAGTLADSIIANNIKEIVFFCGDKRLNTLPDKMKNAGVTVREYVVYTNIETPHIIDRQYDGLLFFSPSGVDSFFKKNRVDTDVKLFSIGNTTATALKKYTDNEIIISKVSTKEQVLLDAVKYFNTI